MLTGAAEAGPAAAADPPGGAYLFAGEGTGLTNADAYSFTVTALSTGGNSAPSVPSSLVNVGVPFIISGTPPSGTVKVA